jgi:hypothetical protein
MLSVKALVTQRLAEGRTVEPEAIPETDSAAYARHFWCGQLHEAFNWSPLE